MQEEYIWNLMAKKLSGEASAEDLFELQSLLKAKPELHYSMQTIIDLWQPEQNFCTDEKETHDAFNRHVERMELLNVNFQTGYNKDADDRRLSKKNKKFFLWSVFSLAFIACLLFFGLKFFPYRASTIANLPLNYSEKAISQVSTKNGSKTNLILPDGTKVWLNAGSSLTYDSSYGKIIREVSLSGEAFFDVVKNKEKPFVIHTSKINVKVLGTEFNVRSYATDKTTEASLIRGSIEVTFKDKPNKKITLKPNEKIVVDNTRHIENIESVRQNKNEKIDAEGIAIKNLTYEHKTGEIIETSWVENKLIFQDESFDEIARQLERWYGVSIKFESEKLKINHLTGSFKNETIRQALDALKFTASFNYEMDSNNNVNIF
jgi:transmembrane sensor